VIPAADFAISADLKTHQGNFHSTWHLGNLAASSQVAAFRHILILKSCTQDEVWISPTSGMDSFRLYTMVVAGSGLAGAAYVLLRRKPKTADELERERRAWLEGTGRITDGTVIDVQELAAEQARRSATLLIYKYDVAGVSYECSQDVTHLRHWINLHTCRLGLHTSVKYDPQNPGNSLVVSESWMGLRQ
jgi:hypothetical protein